MSLSLSGIKRERVCPALVNSYETGYVCHSGSRHVAFAYHKADKQEIVDPASEKFVQCPIRATDN